MIRAATALLTAVLISSTALAKGGSSTSAPTTSEGPNAAASAEGPSAPPSVGGGSALGVPYVLRQGFFVEAQVGVFFAFGGSKNPSNAQPWINADIGFYIPGVKRLSLFLGGGHGFNDGSCRYLVPGPQCENYPLTNDASTGQAPSDFSVIPIDVGVRWGFADVIVPNMDVTGTLLGGYTMFSPALTLDGPTGAPHAGVGVGIEYGTRLPGFSFGIEALVRMTFLPAIALTNNRNNAMLGSQSSQIYPYFTAYPRFQYVF